MKIAPQQSLYYNRRFSRFRTHFDKRPKKNSPTIFFFAYKRSYQNRTPRILSHNTDYVQDLVQSIPYEEECPTVTNYDWNLSYFVSLYKGKGDALCRDNYRGLQMLNQVMKIVETVLDSVIRSEVDIDSM